MLCNNKWGHFANNQKINPMSIFSQAVICNYLQLQILFILLFEFKTENQWVDWMVIIIKSRPSWTPSLRREKLVFAVWYHSLLVSYFHSQPQTQSAKCSAIWDAKSTLKRLGTMIPLEYFRDNSFNAQRSRRAVSWFFLKIKYRAS